jgi:hypothetical protein
MGGILLFLSFDYYFHYYYYSFASFERVLHSLYILCLIYLSRYPDIRGGKIYERVITCTPDYTPPYITVSSPYPTATIRAVAALFCAAQAPRRRA